ncbi:MAG: xylose binding protein transport system [Chloroflexi bacterium]|jgi:D-xylose transport system substrate-binding protein|nr:xylose binding protein transport system [Chloroflexota bacterium]
MLHKNKRVLAVSMLVLSILLSACGDNTATTAPVATTAAAVATTAAAPAATTAAATTAATTATTAAAATTATTAAAATTATTAAAATTATTAAAATSTTAAAAPAGAVSASLPAGFDAAKGCKNVGILLPETDSSARWEQFDHPLLETAIKAAIPGVTIQYANANNNADTQQNQADAALTKGACILVVGAKDADKASAIVQKAKASKVPVIAYDRLIQDNDLSFYVSFDNVKVGELQGQYIVDNHKKGDKVSMINGSRTDNNALLFYQGAMNKLKPLFDSGELVKVYDQFTPDWNNATAQSQMEAALTQTKNDIQIAYVANDGMANSVIAALKAQKLNGKVLVTGQDATVAGVQNIITGDQAMSVYKAIPVEVDLTAKLVAAFYNGTLPSGIINGATKNATGKDIPSALAVPVAIDKNNILTTVIKDNFVPKADLCKGLAGVTVDIAKTICG